MEKIHKQQAAYEKKRIDQMFVVKAKKEEQVASTHKAKAWEAMLKREMDLLRREERWENVRRI